MACVKEGRQGGYLLASACQNFLMYLLVDVSIFVHDCLKAGHLLFPLLNYKLVFWLGNSVGMHLTTCSIWLLLTGWPNPGNRISPGRKYLEQVVLLCFCLSPPVAANHAQMPTVPSCSVAKRHYHYRLHFQVVAC